MKIILKDVKTHDVVAIASLRLEHDDVANSIYRLIGAPIVSTFLNQFEEALYFINNADVTNGVIADTYDDDGEPVNPYLVFELV